MFSSPLVVCVLVKRTCKTLDRQHKKPEKTVHGFFETSHLLEIYRMNTISANVNLFFVVDFFCSSHALEGLCRYCFKNQ